MVLVGSSPSVGGPLGNLEPAVDGSPSSPPPHRGDIGRGGVTGC
jgi:hypothetical protein